MLPLFQAVIFDLDGVLVDSEPLHEKAQRRVFARHQVDIPDDLFGRFKGKTEEAVFEYAVAHFANGRLDVATLVDEKHQVYETLLPSLTMFDGALDLLEALSAQALPLGLTTSATRANQQQVFDMFDLGRYFEVVTTVADVTHPKPHPEPYLTTARRMNVRPDACLVIEDTATGVEAARAARCTVAAVTTTFARADLIEAGADPIVDALSELSAVLQRAF